MILVEPIVLHTGDGLKLVDKNSPQSHDVMNSLDQDVSFVACHASMKSNHMTIDQLHSGVGTVPSGSREIAMRKSNGWTILDDKALKWGEAWRQMACLCPEEWSLRAAYALGSRHPRD
jgi:hypothetical protein